MKVKWIGHSCFKIEKDGYEIVIDPYAKDSVPGLKRVKEKADMVICSHDHRDHSDIGAVKIKKKSSSDSPFDISLIETFHDDVKGAKRGMNTIHILDDGECKLAHMGDLGCQLRKEQKELLRELDAILIPVGGYFTIDAKQAVKLIKEIQPKIVIPMHYRDDERGFGYDVISTVDEFVKLMGGAVNLSSDEIDTNKEYDEQVIILTPQNL